MSHTPESPLQLSRLGQIPVLPVVAYQIVHATIGRLRIKIPRLSQDSDYAQRLEQLVKNLKFVTDLRLSPLTSSVIVNYDAFQVSLDHALPKLVEAIQQTSQAAASLWEMPTSLEGNHRSENLTLFIQPTSGAGGKPPREKMVWLTWLALFLFLGQIMNRHNGDELMSKSDSQAIQARLTELGGGLIGGATGEIAGAAVGGAFVCLVTGPLGLCTSAVMLTFAAGVVGSKLGVAVANTLGQVGEVSSVQDSQPLSGMATGYM